jgi:hypothetical protein
MSKRVEYPNLEKKELFKYLVDNKDKLIAQKKGILKEADGYFFGGVPTLEKTGVGKAVKAAVDANIDALEVKAIINTTNWMDSHYDVHLPKIWNKSLKENNMIMHVQEHKMHMFDKIISEGEDLKAFVKNYSWKELGFNYPGSTQALQFDSIVRRSRNEYMFGQYNNKYVKNHSVGMRYVGLVMCINDEDYGAEYEAWEKYYPEIVNKDVADEKGFFWAIKEAKVIEGSAVPLGSNVVTPTISVQAASKALGQNEAASKALQNELIIKILNN